jgi:DNA-directed RNA polymerase subunit F
MPLNFEVKDEKTVNLINVKKVLGSRKKTELTYEQKMAYENARDFTKLTEKQAEDFRKELLSLEMRKLTDNFIIKIIDVMPESAEDLKILLQSSKISFKKQELEKIFEIVKKYAK